MIVQEPVQAAVWHCLNHYAYKDAIFLSERLHAEVESEESVFLLATCYYRSGQIHQAFWLLKSQGVRTPQARFLMARCAYDLKQFNEAETALSTEDNIRLKHLDDICKEFGEVACFALQLLAKICEQTERGTLATEANKKALKLNPFLWHSFVDLCNRGEKPDPNSIFQITNTDVFSTCQGSAYTNTQVICNNHGNGDSNHGEIINTNLITTPIDNISQCLFHTPNNNINNTINILKCGLGIGNSNNFGINDETPLSANIHHDNNIIINDNIQTPFRPKFKYLTTISPSTPSFGVLPINSPNDSLTTTTIIYTPQQKQQQQQQEQQLKQQIVQEIQQQQQQQTLLEVNQEQKAINKKLKGHVGSLINRKDTPLQQSKPIFNQTGNITPKTPNTLTGQNVRRSSRLFSSNNYSVKENNKSINMNKFTAPRSPPRKTKQQRNKTINNLNNEIKEIQNKMEKEKIETITSCSDNKVLLNNSINNAQNIAQHLLNLKKQSVEGLMLLLKEFGKGYLLLSQYDCINAIKIFNNVPLQHYNSCWLQSMIGLSYYEQRDYNSACNIFYNIHEKEPHRIQYMEIYSSSLWHLQKEVTLSALAQDFMLQDKSSAITWCIAGNCFSLQKEHETAIKFFQRAVQVEPDFPYSYTLLGHELVLTEELDKALSCFRTAILKDSRHYNAWFGIGTIFSKQERYQLAEIHYRRALKINPSNSVIMVHIGAMQFFLQKIDLSLTTLNQAIQLDPKNPLCKFQRGSLYFSMGKYQLALKELEELKQIVPKESVVYYLIGKIYKKMGNIDLALMHFSWASDLDPKGASNQIKDAFDTNIHQNTNNIDLNIENDESDITPANIVPPNNVPPSASVSIETSDDSIVERSINADDDIGIIYDSDSY